MPELIPTGGPECDVCGVQGFTWGAADRALAASGARMAAMCDCGAMLLKLDERRGGRTLADHRKRPAARAGGPSLLRGGGIRCDSIGRMGCSNNVWIRFTGVAHQYRNLASCEGCGRTHSLSPTRAWPIASRRPRRDPEWSD